MPAFSDEPLGSLVCGYRAAIAQELVCITYSSSTICTTSTGPTTCRTSIGTAKICFTVGPLPPRRRATLSRQPRRLARGLEKKTGVRRFSSGAASTGLSRREWRKKGRPPVNVFDANSDPAKYFEGVEDREAQSVVQLMQSPSYRELTRITGDRMRRRNAGRTQRGRAVRQRRRGGPLRLLRRSYLLFARYERNRSLVAAAAGNAQFWCQSDKERKF